VSLKFQIIGTEQHKRENAMQEFIDKSRDQINGTRSGFEHLVFRGSLRRLHSGCWEANGKAFVSAGMEPDLGQNHIRFQDYFPPLKGVSQRRRDCSVNPGADQRWPILCERSPAVDKEELAREVAWKRKLGAGLVCALTRAERSPTLEQRGRPRGRRERPCGVVYHDPIPPEVGGRYARMQPWFPFQIQVGMNGREWLARPRDQPGLPYRQPGNGLVGIEDYGPAQPLRNQQGERNGAARRNGLARQWNPLQEGLFAPSPAR
jgi:hypothetical protein